MKPFAACVVLLFSLTSLRLPAQVSFFQPPTYAAGNGTLFVADFNDDGKPDILTSVGTLNLGHGDGTFTTGTQVTGTPLAVADFNGDGKPDILEQGTGTLLVLLGNGDGTFQAPISSPSAASLSVAAAADLNGDGKADAVGVYNGSMLVYISNGDGTFAPGVSYNLEASSVNAPVIAFGDFNGDHNPDVVVAFSDNTNAGHEVAFLGNGNGTFQTAKSSTGVNFSGPVAVGDFNGDGKLDLSVGSDASCSTCTGSASTYVQLGNGDGTFQAPILAFSGMGPMIAADLNGDGKLDLILQGDSTVARIYLGNGDSTFSNANNYIMSQSQGLGVAVADFNLDGKLDIAVGNALLLGNGNGTFQGVPFGAIPGTGELLLDRVPAAVIGKFDNSHAAGVAVLSNRTINPSSYHVYILSNDGSGMLSLAHTYTIQAPGQEIAAADLNGDGNLDLVVTSLDTTGWSYTVLLGNGDGSFQAPVFYPQNVQSQDPLIAVADFNNDHKADLAIAAGNAQDLAVLLGNGDGTFAPPVYYFDAQGSTPFPLLAADFNSDGKVDIAVGATTASGLETAILNGNGDGTFQPAIFPASLNNFSALSTADLNGDGKPDLVSGNQVALGNGDGTFTELPVLGINIFIVGLADLNGDGKTDAVSSFFGGSTTLSGVLLGKGDGTFAPIVNVPNDGALPFSNLIADMNGDGRPDLVFLWTSSVNGVAVLLNTTPAGFELSASPLSPTSVSAGNSASSTVTATPIFGFNGSVTLSCQGLPSGASCTFNPASIASGSGNSMLTITSSGSTPAGMYLVQIEGSAGSITSNATLSIVVQQPPDFTIGPGSGSTSQTIAPGQTASFSLTLATVGSFSGTVNLSCSITPTVTAAPTCGLPSSVQIGGGGAVPVTVTVATSGPSAAATVFYPFPSLVGTGSLAGMLILSMPLLLGRRRRLSALAMPMIMLSFASLLSCGGSSSHANSGTPPGTYQATITASSGNQTHDAVVQVVVQQ